MAKKTCPAVAIYESLSHCKGETVLPGLRPEAYFISKSQIVTFPKLPDLGSTGATMATLAVYPGNFTLAADAKWHKLDVLDSKSNQTSSSQGEYPSKTFVVNATLKYAGNNEDAAGFCRLANADDMIFIVRMRNGKYRVIGNEMFTCNVNPSQDSGMAVTDESGTTLEISTTDVCPAPFYTGTLVTEDGTIDCSTGEIEAAP